MVLLHLIQIEAFYHNTLTQIMNKALLKNLCLSAAASMFVTSCGTSTDTITDTATKIAADAAVDAATKKTDPLTSAAVRKATGYGTDPVEKAKADMLNKVGL